jgi:hypothetical protein
VAFFVESGVTTVAEGLPSQPARAIMLAAKNNRSRLDITQSVQICEVLLRNVTKATGVMVVGVEYSLESDVSWSRRWEPVFARWIFEGSPFDLRWISS